MFSKTELFSTTKFDFPAISESQICRPASFLFNEYD